MKNGSLEDDPLLLGQTNGNFSEANCEASGMYTFFPSTLGNSVDLWWGEECRGIHRNLDPMSRFYTLGPQVHRKPL